MSQSQVELPPQHTRKQKHRPQSLDLKSGAAERGVEAPGDVAHRIVSPGLPQLNEAMKCTVKISQQIELQQKSLIAAIHSGNSSFSSKMASDESSEGEDDSGDNMGVTEESERQTTPTVLTTVTAPASVRTDESMGGDSRCRSDDDSSEELLTPTIKRLKRKHTPASLNIGATRNTSLTPTIQSAPIRQTKVALSSAPRQTNGAVRKTAMPYAPMNPNGSIVPTPMMYQVISHLPIQRRGYGPHVQTPLAYQAVPMAQPSHMYPLSRRARPYTTTTSQFPRGASKTHAFNTLHASSQHSSAHINSNKNTTSVTDVYHGDYTREAPLRSQPLSAQKDFFGISKTKRKIEDDRIPVSEEERKEMEAKYRTFNDQNNTIARSPGDTAIVGSINLMNESVFNFKIFKQPSPPSASSNGRQTETPEPSSSLSKDSNSKFKATPSTATDSNLSRGSSTVPSPDLVSKSNREKQKFLEICETSWNEFFSAKKPKLANGA